MSELREALDQSAEKSDVFHGSGGEMRGDLFRTKYGELAA